MKRMACVECGHAITLLRGINCRVINVQREYDEKYMAVICTLEAYCAHCGKKSAYSVKHYFSRVFDKIPTEYLIEIALYSQDISLSV